MPTVSTTVLPLGVYGPSRASFTGFAVPVGVSVIVLSVNRTQLASLTLNIDFSLELSPDGGTIWLPWGAASMPGGDVIDPRTLAVRTESSIIVPLLACWSGERKMFQVSAVPPEDEQGGWSIIPGFEPTNTLRRLRGQINLNESCTTQVSVTTV